jgi:hypothetical protein
MCHKGKYFVLIKHKIKTQNTKLLAFLDYFHYICTHE